MEEKITFVLKEGKIRLSYYPENSQVPTVGMDHEWYKEQPLSYLEDGIRRFKEMVDVWKTKKSGIIIKEN